MFESIAGVSVRESWPSGPTGLVVFTIHGRSELFGTGERGIRATFHLDASEYATTEQARTLVYDRWVNCLQQMWVVAAKGLATVATKS